MRSRSIFSREASRDSGRKAVPAARARVSLKNEIGQTVGSLEDFTVGGPRVSANWGSRIAIPGLVVPRFAALG